MSPRKVAILTAGGLAPCLSSCVASLIEEYTEQLPETEIYCYLNGFRALPISDKVLVTPEMRRQVHKLHFIGGSPIGNSRVSLDNKEDCYRRKLVPEGANPWHVACDSLVNDGIDVVHPIGGDGTSIGAARLAHFTHERHNGYKLSVLGLPKTIDNDIVPISQSLGAHTAAEQGALYFGNVVGENSASNNVLLVHELMGRRCGYLAAQTARFYRDRLNEMVDLTGTDYKRDIHAIYLPEMEINFELEVKRLRDIMSKIGCVNIFVSEGACVPMITKQLENSGKKVERDQSGNIRLSNINVGEWIAKNFGPKIGSEKNVTVKSGYFCRAAAADDFDKKLIKNCCKIAVKEAIKKSTGIIGPNENKNDQIELIPLEHIKGGRKFDIIQKWFSEMMLDIGQPFKFDDGYVRRKTLNSRKISVFSAKKNPIRNKGLFTDKKELSSIETELSNEVNFASRSSLSLLHSSDREEYLFKNLINKFSGLEISDAVNLNEVIERLMVSFKFLSEQIIKAGVLGDHNDKNTFKMLSNVAENTIRSSLQSLHSVKNINFRAEKFPKNSKNLDENFSKFDIYCDALDGESNIKANISTGTLFGIYRNDSSMLPKCNKIVVSGYCLFGTSVILSIAFPNRVVSFKLNQSSKKFELMNDNLRIPDGECFSVNTSYYQDWDRKTKNFINNCQNKKRMFRYIGSMVADVHRTLLHGGIFMYPPNNKFPNGKMKLTTEANTIAFLIESAGGKATDGERSISLLQPSNNDDTTPIFAGSPKLIEEFEAS